MDFKKEIKKIATLARKSSIERSDGGPFGAFVFDERKGVVVARACNRVVAGHDPTAHAEIRAIRAACRKLKTHDLSGLSLYATGYPCPMCMSAIIWANIKTVYYSQTYGAAAKIGFRDDFISKFIKGGCTDASILKLERVKEKSLDAIYAEYGAAKAAGEKAKY